jgi:hypothetical protein
MDKKLVEPKKTLALTITTSSKKEIAKKLREYSKSNLIFLSHWRALKEEMK